MPSDAKKVYLPKSPVPPSRGITGYKDFHGNVVVVDRVTGQPLPKEEQPSAEKTPSSREVAAKPTKKAGKKATITSQPGNGPEKGKSAGDLSNL